MKYCDHCGSKVEQDEEKCPYCGASLTEKQDDELTEAEVVTTMMIMDLL